MKLQQKIVLLAVTPLILALCAIAFAVWHQATSLVSQQRAAIETAYLASKEAEISSYVTIATRSIAHLYESGRQDSETQDKAKAILAKLDYGDDGYFFIYDMHGTNLMHPRLPHLIGQNLWDLKDAHGNPTIQRLTERAKLGGGFERYMWEKPSTGKITRKLGYVVMLEKWGWMLGTGLYLDDVDAALARIDAESANNINGTMLWIAAIAITSVLIIALSGLALNVSESRVADAKLKVLAQRVVRSQEEERARLSRDLHDGISQWLVSIKLQIESGIAKLSAPAPRTDAACISFDRAATLLNEVLGEVRRISHNLRPAVLDDLGLAAALTHLTQEFATLTQVKVEFETHGTIDGVPDVAKTALFRIAQEALTNISRHAQAAHVNVRLEGDRKGIRLIIEDDGVGFNVAQIAEQPKSGIGLRNMHERLEAIGGKLHLISSSSGTQVVALFPHS